MTFAPALPVTGLAGWRFLERTAAAQKAAFDKTPEMKWELDFFKANIHKITGAEQLVSDRILFKVALGAFGLDDEIGKKFFMRKVLEEGTENDDAFANRLVDTRYRDFAKAFGFGNSSGTNTALVGFSKAISEAYSNLQVERAIGSVDNDMRVAMTFRREIRLIAHSPSADTTAWFQVMGNPPLRNFFEQAYNLPKNIGALDIDRQREIFKEKTRQIFGSGSLESLRSPKNIETITRLYFAKTVAAKGPGTTTPGFAAIAILASGSASLANLLRSQSN